MFPPAPSPVGLGLHTDRYEFTMVSAALRDGTAATPCVFSVFARRLPDGRRYGVVAGVERVLEAVTSFRFGADERAWLRSEGVIDEATDEFLRDYRFRGDIDGYREGELFFPYSPIMTVRGTFAEAVLLETVVLSILNHDSAIAAAGARMVSAATERTMIEMGSRRAHEVGALHAARAAYIAGFDATSNVAAGLQYGIPTGGTAAHAFTLVHGDELAAFQSQVRAHGPSTTLLVDTYDITRGIANAVEAAGPELGAIRIDSGDLTVLARQARQQLDGLGNHNTKIVVSSDLDEYAIAGLAAAPVDVYGVGTSVVVGSGAPTAGLVYKLVEVDGRPVAKRSEQKASRGGAKIAFRSHRASGTATDELVLVGEDGRRAREVMGEHAGGELVRIDRALMREGEPFDAGLQTIAQSRELVQSGLRSLPWEGLSLSKGDPALATQVIDVD